MFSGRRDPEWEVPAVIASELVRSWHTLPIAAQAPQVADRLGYRGCALHSPDGREWWAQDGLILSRHPRQENQTRIDKTHAWERKLIGTAPPGLLPPGIALDPGA